MNRIVAGKLTWSIVLFVLFGVLAGCAGPPPSPVVTLTGSDPSTVPPPSPEQQLIGLVNQFRTGAGLAAVTEDATMDSIAQTHSAYMASIGQLTPIMNGQDFTMRLIGAGLAPGPTGTAGAYLAQAYGTPQTLFNAMSAQNSIMSGNYTRIGVGMANPGNGNWWTVLFY